MRKHAPVVSIVGLILLLCCAGCGREKSEVVARVNQQPLTQRQLWDYLEKADNGEAGRRGLDSLIVRQLIRQEAKKRGIEVSREEIETRLEALEDYILAATGKDFGGWLQDRGLARDDLISRISLQILTAKLVLTETDRQKYFEDNKDRLSDLPHNNDSVIYRQIVVESEEEANATYNELTSEEGGTDFAALAEERSLDMLTRQRGGMAGWLVKGKSDDPDVEDALFSLGPGEVSKPMLVKAPAGAEEQVKEGEEPPKFYRIVKVEKRFPAPKEITFEDNEDVIEDWMLNEPSYQMQLHEFLSGLRSKADVEIVSPRYQSLGEVYRRGREERERRLGEEPPDFVPLSPGVEGDMPVPMPGPE
jgi:predicted Fe-S protein YdhL (DUF1289 family)